MIDLTIHAGYYVDSVRTADHSTQLSSDVATVRFGDELRMQGTLADLLTVIGRAHEQLLAIEAARAEAEPEASDG